MNGSKSILLAVVVVLLVGGGMAVAYLSMKPNPVANQAPPVHVETPDKKIPAKQPIKAEDWDRTLESANKHANLIAKLGDFEALVMREAHASWQAVVTGRLTDDEFKRSRTAAETIVKIGIENASPQMIETARLGFDEEIFNLRSPMIPSPSASTIEVANSFPVTTDYTAGRLEIEKKKDDAPSLRIVQARALRDLEKKNNLTIGDLKRLQNCGMVWFAYSRAVAEGRKNKSAEKAAKAWAVNVAEKSPDSKRVDGEMVAIFWSYMGTLTDKQIEEFTAAIESSQRPISLAELRSLLPAGSR